jgi:hypothetical protein
MRWAPRGYGGARRPPEKVKADGWREQGLLAVSIDDQRLKLAGARIHSSDRREALRQQAATAGGGAWIN